MPQKLPQKCTKSHISHISYPIFLLCLTARNVACNFSAISVKKMHEKREPGIGYPGTFIIGSNLLSLTSHTIGIYRSLV